MRPGSPSPDQVRRCARCGEAALVCVRDWQHRVLGIDTGTRTLELACGSCGIKVTLHPRKQIVVERVFAVLLLPALFPGLYFFFSARRKARAWTDNPLVAGTSAPPPRGPADRICTACGGSARCTAMFRRQMLRMSVGTRYRYACSRCLHAFTVHDGRSVAFSLSIATLLTATGALVTAIPPGTRVGAEASNRLFGVGVLVVAAMVWVAFALQLRARRAHPVT